MKGSSFGVAIKQSLLSDEDAARHPGEIERGSFAPHADTVTNNQRQAFVVVSFNLRYGVGARLISGSLLRRVGIRRPGRRASLVARNLERAAQVFTSGRLLPTADLIALQEADRGTVRAGNHHVARELAQQLRMDYARAAMNLPRGEPPKANHWYLDFEEHINSDADGTTGVALLSRLPLAHLARVELPFAECAWRPRLALAASIEVAARCVRVFNSHIDPHAGIDQQLAQHESVLAHAARTNEPTILLGDFNTLTPDARTRMRQLLEAHGYTTPQPTGVATWRAGFIRLHTDWIFTRGLQVLRWGVARPLSISDHWPVWAELTFADAQHDAR